MQKFYLIATGFITYLVAHPIFLLALNNSSTSEENPQKHSESWLVQHFFCMCLSGIVILCYQVFV